MSFWKSYFLVGVSLQAAHNTRQFFGRWFEKIFKYILFSFYFGIWSFCTICILFFDHRFWKQVTRWNWHYSTPPFVPYFINFLVHFCTKMLYRTKFKLIILCYCLSSTAPTNIAMATAWQFWSQICKTCNCWWFNFLIWQICGSCNWCIEKSINWTYTVLHFFRQVLFGAGNQGNHQNVDQIFYNVKWLCRQ